MAAAVPALVYLWGFTVDDALIPARYATHVARGLGYRFNATGPSTDGVTPLGWPYLLAPFASEGPLAAFAASRVLGVMAWLGAAGALGSAVARVQGGPWRFAALLIVLFSPSLGAWASAGLETGVVIALSTVAAVLPAHAGFALTGAAVAGACAWLRPDMIAYALVLGWGRGLAADGPRRRAFCSVLAVFPWCLAASIRWLVWRRPAPLAVLSKPSDLAHGLVYVAGAFALSGGFVAALGPLAWRRLPPWPKFLGLAAIAHLIAVAIAGGDWMPFARLVAPVLPPLVLVTAHLLGGPGSLVFAKLRLALACAGEIAVFVLRGPAARRVVADRMALIDAARRPLTGALRVATVDVGWVGAATDADLIDLAGATDPEIAALPGGHTSKAVSGALLTGRGPSHVVFQLAPASGDRRYAREVETRLGTDPLVRRAYRVTWTSPATLPIQYEILTPRPPEPRTSDLPSAD
jgi:hypothetical protein